MILFLLVRLIKINIGVFLEPFVRNYLLDTFTFSLVLYAVFTLRYWMIIETLRREPTAAARTQNAAKRANFTSDVGSEILYFSWKSFATVYYSTCLVEQPPFRITWSQLIHRLLLFLCFLSQKAQNSSLPYFFSTLVCTFLHIDCIWTAIPWHRYFIA